MGSRRLPVVVLLLMGLSAVWAVTASLVVFPHLSVDSDEGVYLLQADALRHGHLFPPVHEPAGAFVPWLSAVRGDHYVTKYAPVQPAIIATAETVFRSPRAALALIAAGIVLVTYLAARRLLDHHRTALVAAAFMASSPLVLVQTATFLPYAGELLLLGGFATAVSAPSARRLALAGALFGLALFARPFDAVLFAGPFVLWLLVRRGLPISRRVGDVAWLGLGAVLPVASMLAYYRAATGSPFRAPFNLLDASDSIGFGSRRMLSIEAPLDFNLGLGTRALATQALLMTFWCFGGLVLVGLAAVGLRAAARNGALLALATTALTVPLGYLFFWGTYNALSWGAPFHLGPYYWMPILLPLTILGARGFHALASHERDLARAAVVGMALLSILVTGYALRTADQLSDSDRRAWAAIHAADVHDAVVFLPERQLGHPLQEARNGTTFDGDVVWAVDRGNCANAAVLRAFPGRRAYLLTMRGRYRSRPVDTDFEVDIRPLPVPCPP